MIPFFFLCFLSRKQQRRAQGGKDGQERFDFPKTGDYAGLQANRPRFSTENPTFLQTPSFSRCAEQGSAEQNKEYFRDVRSRTGQNKGYFRDARDRAVQNKAHFRDAQKCAEQNKSKNIFGEGRRLGR
ncbi:MAG: hypothetical protein RSB29_06460 [Alistipes sp.]